MKIKAANKKGFLGEEVKFLTADEINENQEFYAVECAGINDTASISLPALFVRTYAEAENLKICLNQTYKPANMRFYILKDEGEK